jgi:hypothetical protein
MKKGKLIIAVMFALATVAAFAFYVNATTSTRANNAALFKDHVNQSSCADWGQTTLTNEATSSVDTRCKLVEACVATIDSVTAATYPHYITCKISSTSNAVVLGADTIGGTAAATTTVSWEAFGYGSNY